MYKSVSSGAPISISNRKRGMRSLAISIFKLAPIPYKIDFCWTLRGKGFYFFSNLVKRNYGYIGAGGITVIVLLK